MAVSRKAAGQRFLDVALSKTGPCGLSYPNHDLRWLIRKDLLALLRDFPSLTLHAIPFPPSLQLLAASGPLLSLPTPPLGLTLVLHPSHPHLPPLVFLHPPPPSHPFVDPCSGALTTPYLLAWRHPTSTLPALVRNLVHIFSLRPDHSPSPSPREALDRLSMRLLSDAASFSAAAREEADALLALRSALSARASTLLGAIRDLQSEQAALRETVEELAAGAAELDEWLGLCTDREGSRTPGSDEDSVAFQYADRESELTVQLNGTDWAMDDTMKVLEKALEEKVVSLGEYLKEIRALAKEQFYTRDIRAYERCSLPRLSTSWMDS